MIPRKVGICWSGATEADDAAHKNIPLTDFLVLAEIPGIELHSLQVGEAAKEMGTVGAYGLIADRSPEIHNMLDTTNIIAGLDLVVSVDTAVAHLAGAMGKPVWLLYNQRGGDGRWKRFGDDTVWYLSMRIWRRFREDSWAAVLGRVGRELQQCGV